MKTISFYYFIFITFLFLSCTNDKVQSVKVKGKYEIELPKTLTKADNLHEDASLQYQNIFSEFYTIVIDEPIADFNDMVKFDFLLKGNYSPDLNGYAYLLKDNLSAAIKNGKLSPLESTKINGLEAKLMTVSGTVDGLNVYYQLGFIKGKEHYYQIVNWTELKRKDDHTEKMAKIISSFKELNRNKKKIQ